MIKPNGERNKSVAKTGKWKTRKVKKLERDIVEAILSDPINITCTAVAEKLGKSIATVSRHMRKPEVQEGIRKHLWDYADNHLILHAMKNISTAIIKDKDTDLSKWLMESLGFFPEKLEQGGTDPWKEFQTALADGITEVLKQCNSTIDKDGDGEGAEPDPETFVYYQPQRPVVEN